MARVTRLDDGHTVTNRLAGAGPDAPPGVRDRADVSPSDQTGNGSADGGDRASNEVAESPPPVVPGTEWFVRKIHGPLEAMWARGFRFLFVLDAVGLFALMFLINLVRFGTTAWPEKSTSFYLGGFATATAIHLTVNYFFGLYEREPRLGYRPWLPRAFASMLLGAGIQAIAFVVLSRYLMPRISLVAFTLAGTVLLGLNRQLSRFLALRRQGSPRVVLVGPKVDVDMAGAHLADQDRDATVVGIVESTDDLAHTVSSTGATDVLLLDVTAFGTIFPQPLNSLEDDDIGFLQRVSGRETLLGLQSVRQVAGMPFVRLRSHAMPSYKLRLKRLLDLAIVVVLLPLWLLVMGALTSYVWIRAGRPVFYSQARVGYGGAEFSLFKFRTMVDDAERDAAVLSPAGDSRVVKGLQWMRDTRLDELPQVISVIRGHMSLVGPRPERPDLVRGIAGRVPGYVLRHEMPPGMTGLAQTYGRYSTDPEYKLGYDLQYMVNWSPVLDLQILLRTVWVVLSRRV